MTATRTLPAADRAAAIESLSRFLAMCLPGKELTVTVEEYRPARSTKQRSADWWERALADHKESGRRDADVGRYTPPHAGGDEDPQDADENAAYKKGFMERRRELGEAFKWA